LIMKTGAKKNMKRVFLIMIDLNSKSKISDRINYYLDSALELEQQFQPERSYFGGSRVGVECERALQYEFLKTPVDHGKHFPARVLRIFERGHWVESAMIKWMRNAGFGLIKGTKDGGQFGFKTKILDQDVAGHNDGIIVSGPYEFSPWPRLWECKGIQEKDWKELQKKGLKSKYPVYYGQVQFYMKYFNLTDNPAWFSAINMNRMDIYWEVINFDENFTYLLDEKVKRIINSSLNGEMLPRISQDETFYKCRWCNWHKRCWDKI
ncbi:MAG: hypothetical protein ACQESP_12235, partial [Candidatus Muiribacteriota bacterium]